VGLETSRIFAAANRLLTDQAAYAAMAQVRTLYGDGKAAARICDILASDARE
jgi:UDP-N-acetylglucosamine 2-epimerase (non-hydrolysing)